MINKPVSLVEISSNVISIVDKYGTSVCTIHAKEETDLLTLKDFEDAKEIVYAINTYGF